MAENKLRLDNEDQKMLDDVAKMKKISKSEVLRKALREFYGSVKENEYWTQGAKNDSK